MIVVSQISPQLVHQTWPKVEKFFADVVAKASQSYSLEQMRTEVFMNRWALIVAEEDGVIIGAMAMQYQNRMNDRVAFIFVLGGNSIVFTNAWEQVKNLFMKNGATAIEGSVRPSMVRLVRRLGLHAKYQVVGMKL